MIPDQLAKSDTEHAHQRAFFQWINYATRYGYEQAKQLSLGEKHFTEMQGITPHLPELGLMHAIPNGGFRNKSEAGKLRAEGVKPGVLDTFLPVTKPYKVPKFGGFDSVVLMYAGLYVEFKEPGRKNHAKGGMSKEQIEFAEAVQHQGYCTRTAYTWREAANIVMLYYGVDTRFETS